MKRTQIYLPEELHDTVRRIAYEQRRSMADVIREAVSSYVDRQSADSAGSKDVAARKTA
ncbi:MAG: CopG family transcriptional regulator [Chloroflexota bacterium]|nr:CopG family transcriptional regulator [Chloroflexota bacterium]